VERRCDRSGGRLRQRVEKTLARLLTAAAALGADAAVLALEMSFEAGSERVEMASGSRVRAEHVAGDHVEKGDV
jgi:uncharacterized protein YbjQ (UPF0145 family)